MMYLSGLALVAGMCIMIVATVWWIFSEIYNFWRLESIDKTHLTKTERIEQGVFDLEDKHLELTKYVIENGEACKKEREELRELIEQLMEKLDIVNSEDA